MGGIGFNGSPDCQKGNGGSTGIRYGHLKLAGCFLPSPSAFPQWPPKHQTATTLVSSSTVSRISSGLPRSSDGALTSTASAKSLQSPTAAASTATATSNSSKAPKKGPASTTTVIPLSTNLSTTTLISVAPSQSGSASNSLPTTTNSINTLTAAPIISNSATTTASSTALQSSDQFLTVTGLAGIVTPTAQAAAQQTEIQPAPFPDTNMSTSPRTDLVIGLVVGIILGVMLLTLPVTYFIYRRRARKQAHRRSIGAIEADRMFRPWKRAEMNLRRRTANMTSLFNAEKGSELAMPPPVFAPLRPNRSSSLYSGSMFAGIEHLTPQQPEYDPMEPIIDRDSYDGSFDNESIRSSPFDDEKRSSSRFSGYIYSDNPFEAPLIAPERPTSVVVIRKLPKEYKGKIKFGMGVQRSS